MMLATVAGEIADSEVLDGLPDDLLVRVSDGQLCLAQARVLQRQRAGQGATVTELSVRERRVMEHSLGWPKCYRNHYCASEGHHEWPTLMALCERWLMRVYRVPAYLSGGHTVFVVTSSGREALGRDGVQA